MTDEQFAAIMKAISEVQTRVYALEFVVGQLGGRIELSRAERSAFVTMPRHCYSCGVILMGGATKHNPGCEVQAMIDNTLNQMGSKGPGQ